MSRCTLDPISTREMDFKIYSFLVYDSLSQIQIARILDCTRQYISKRVKRLEKSGVIVKKKGSTKPVQYVKGPTSIQYDALSQTINFDRELTKKDDVNAGGVNIISKHRAVVQTGRAHRLNCELEILKEGDYQPFLNRKSEIHNNKQEFSLDVPHQQQDIDGVATLTLSRTYKKGEDGSLIIKNTKAYLDFPQIDITIEDHNYLEKMGRVLKDVKNYMQKHHGWRFGDALKTDVKPHFGVELPIMQGLADKQDLRATNSDIYSSDSDDKTELETNTLEVALVLMNMPGRILSAEEQIAAMQALQQDHENKFAKTFTELVATKQLLLEYVSIHNDVTAKLIEANTKTDRILTGLSSNVSRIAGSIGTESLQCSTEDIKADTGGMYL